MDSSDPCSQTSISSLVADFLCNRLKSHGYEWKVSSKSPSTVPVAPTLSQALQSLSQSFMAQFGDRIQAMTESMPSSGGDVVDGSIEVCPSSLSPSCSSSDDLIDYPVFKVVADELFSCGYEWSHLLTLLIFASEIAYTRGVAKGHPEFINSVHEYIVRYITDSPSLRSWIQSQNGWNGFMEYALQQSNSTDASNATAKHFSSLGSGLMVGLGTAVSFAIASMTYAFVRS